MNKITIRIDGMMCGMCEAHICDAIRNAFPDEKKVRASKGRREATFLTDREPAADELKKTITDTGYTFVSAVSEPYKKSGIFHF
jgi:copper chaperone CopZ